jgi:dihydrofolate reductase
MRKLVVTENITVDIVATNSEHSAAADALLVGRNTFEAFRDFWPKQIDDPTGVSDYLNRVNKYVLSRTIGDSGWQNTTVLRGDLVEEVQALKAAPGRDIVATGSVQLVQALVATGLVDEYRLFVFPIVVGRGARLFDSGEMQLRLLETRPFISGVVLLRYSSLATPAASTA